MVCSLERFHLDHIKAKSSGLVAADGVVFAKPCWYLGATIATNSGYISIYDSPDSTLTGDIQIDTLCCSAEKLSTVSILEEPLWCSKGIFVTINQYTINWIVWYSY